MPLYLDAGFSTNTGKRDNKYDTCLTVIPSSGRGNTHGALFAIADGVVERPDAERAAHTAIHELSESYYTTIEGWGLQQALKESFDVANHAVLSSGEHGRAAALSALILRGRRWVVGHAGNTRVWMFRDHQLKLLTRDHVHPRPRDLAQVYRACGLDRSFDAEFAAGELAEGDIFLLTSDGVHDALDSSWIRSALQTDVSAQQMAEILTRRALETESRDNVSACVARVEKLPSETDADLEEDIAALPLIDPPQANERVDGFVIKSLIHKSRRYRLYQAVDEESGETVALKFPNPRFRDDPEFTNSFLREEWVGKRVNSSYLVRMLPMRAGRRTALYSVMAYHKGENLSKRIRRKQGLPVRQALLLVEQLLSALSHLHHRGVIHRDIRPKSLLLDKKSRQLLLIGLGLSRIESLHEQEKSTAIPVSALSYVAPELFDEGNEENVRTDIYAAGVTLYHMLTGKYPYGKIKSTDQELREFISPTHYKANLPLWLDEVLQQACALDPAERFTSADEFIRDLKDAQARNNPKTASHASPPHATTRSNAWAWILIIALVGGLLFYLANAF